MKRQKMITLCPITYELAKDIPNFSGWVRDKLKETLVKREEFEGIALKYICNGCNLTLHTRTDINGIPHATRYLGGHADDSCIGTFVRDV